MKEDDTMSRLTADTLRIGDTEYPVYDAPLPGTWVRAAAMPRTTASRPA